MGQRFKSAHRLQNIMRNETFFNFVQHEARGFVAGSTAAILLAIAMWYMWQNRTDHTITTISSPATTTALVLLNLALAFWSIRREPFASYLLLGTTIILELLALVFMYLV